MDSERSSGASSNDARNDSGPVSCVGLENCALMQTCPLFSGLSVQECKGIVSYACNRTFDRNEFMFLQGQPVQNLILLQSGSVKHTQLSHDGNEVLIRTSGIGEVFDVQGGSVSRSYHSYSARAMERCNALVWEYSRLQRYLAQYPQMRQNISHIIASRIRELEESFCELATKNVAQRLALALLRSAKKVGKTSEGGIQVLLSRNELAQMTGATVYTISRIISRWSEQGFVASRVKALFICDAMRLEAISSDNERVN
jgi:CRP-like cAMP-binding protein